MKSKSPLISLAALVLTFVLWTLLIPNRSDQVERPISESVAVVPMPERSRVPITSSPSDETSSVPQESIANAWKDPKDWSNATVSEEVFSPVPGNPNRTLRRRLVHAPDFAFPIVHEELIENDEATGEPVKTTLLAAMAAQQLVILAKEKTDGKDFAALAESIGWRVEQQNEAAGWAVIKTDDPQLDTIAEALRDLRPFVQEAGFAIEPNYIVYALASPNDTRFARGEQWGLENATGGDIGALAAWDIRTDARSAVVAVVDSGIRLDHEDLKQNLWSNPGEIPSNGLDDDGNGFVDDVNGFNFIERKGDPSDDNGHGTHVAGIIGARGNNGKGIAGVAWQAQLMALKFLNGEGRGTLADGIAALDYAGENGAKIINASWGGANYSKALESAIQRLQERGVIVVAAAGNDGEDIDSYPSYPAALDADNLISVASMQRSGSLSYFSNYGIRHVDLAAPGANITSCWNSEADAYTTLSGTSMAAPMVSGVLALNAAQHPQEDYITLLDRIAYTVTAQADFRTHIRTGGYANLQASLALDKVPYPPKLLAGSPSRQSVFVGEPVEFKADVSSRSESPTQLQWLFNDTEIAGANGVKLRIESADETRAGRYSLRARNDDGEATLTFTLGIYQQDNPIANALDTPGHVRILSDQKEKWEVVESPESKGGSHVGLPFANHTGETNLYTEMEGSGVLRFKWRLPEYRNEALYLTYFIDDIPIYPSYGQEWIWVESRLTKDGTHRTHWNVTGSNAATSVSPYIVEIDDLQYYEIGKSPPQITWISEDQEVAPVGSFRLSVYALGDDLAYQWYKDDLPLQGANLDSLRIDEADEGHAGAYHVVVSNDYGTETSGKVQVTIQTVGIEPFFTERGDSYKYVEGERIELSLKHGGSQPITYQWFKDEQPIPGADGPTLLFDPIRPEHAGSYYLKIANKYWSNGRYSDRLWIYVDGDKIPPRFYVRPDYVSQNVAEVGKSAGIGFDSPGSGNIEYQWFKDGEPIDGLSDRELFFDPVTMEDRGTYYLEARNALGLAQSHRIELIVKGGGQEALDFSGGNWDNGGIIVFANESDDPGITFDGEDSLSLRSTYGHDSTTESVSLALTGPLNLSFRWKQSPNNSSQLLLTLDGEELVFANGGEDWEQVSCHVPAGTHTLQWSHYIYQQGDDAWIDLLEETKAPAFTHLYRFTVPLTETGALLNGTATGPGTIAYQWYKNGNPLPGKTQPTLTVTTADPSDAFQIKAYSQFGETLSNPIRVVPTSTVTGESRYPIILGGEAEWSSTLGYYQDDTVRDGSLLANLQPGETAWFRFDSTEASILAFSSYFYLFFSATATFDGQPLEIVELYDASQSGYSHFVSIPQGTGTVLFKVKNNANDQRPCYFYSIRVLPSPSILLLPSDYDPLNNIYTELQMTFGATQENTVKWYRNGELISTEQSPPNYNSLPFGHIYGSPKEEDVGTYYCEIFDSYGNSARSDEFEIIPYQYSEDILDHPNVSYSSATAKRKVDYQEYTTGGSSFRFEVPPDSSNSHSTLQFDFRGLASPEQPATLKIKRSDPSVHVYLSDGRNNERRLDLAEDWSSIDLLFTEAAPVLFRFENTGTTAAYVWIDGAQTDGRLQILSQPKNYGTYIGGPATLKAEALPASGTSYQWTHEGEPIPGAIEPTLQIDSVQQSNLGHYAVRIDNGTASLLSETAEISLIDSLGEAIEQPGLKISTSGDAFWSIDKSTSIDGSWSLRSGEVDYGEWSSLRIDFDQPGMAHLYRFATSPKESFLREYGAQAWQGQNFTLFENENYLELTVAMESYDLEVSYAPHTIWIDRLSFQPVPLVHYSEWADSKLENQAHRPLSGSLADAFADSDGDGMINLFEFALNLDPFAYDQPPAISLHQEAGAITGEVSYDIVPHPDYNVSIETTRDGKQWNLLQPQIVSRAASADGLHETLKVRFQMDLEEGQTLLARWRIAGTGAVNAPISRTHSEQSPTTSRQPTE